MKIAIRADANATIGAGHLSRCCTIALAALQQGHDICFFSRSDSEAWLRKAEVPFIILPVSAENETEAFINHAKQYGADWSIVDSYLLSSHEYKAIHSAMKSVVIDDYARLPYHADILLNANLYAPDLDYSDVHASRFLLGRQYTILREEFRTSSIRPMRKNAINVTVTMGGSDMANVTPVVLDALRGLEDIFTTIIVGPYSGNLSEINAAVTKLKGQAQILQAPNNIAEIFANSDLAISAAGSTSYELFALGIPSLLVSCAVNQDLGLQYFHKNGLAISLGKSEQLTAPYIADQVRDVLGNNEKRLAMHKNVLESVNKNGVQSILEALAEGL